MKYFITTTATESRLEEVEGEIFTVDQFTCGVHQEEVEDDNATYTDSVVTELGTGMQVCRMMDCKDQSKAIKEARRLFAHNDPGRFMMRAKATLRDMGLSFPVNDVSKMKEVANG